MKKFISFLFCFLILGLVACSKIPQKTPQRGNVNSMVAIELEKLDKNYSDETLKALSVILRTNIIINSVNYPDLPKEKYLLIANSTKNQTLVNKNNSLIEISLDNTEDYTWQKSIKKSKLLEFALKNNINLTNISNIEPVLENNKVIGLNIGKKYFDYFSLAKEFKLESNIIESVENDKSDIVIKGKNKGFYDNFDTYKSEQLSNDNYDYKKILKTFFNDLKII